MLAAAVAGVGGSIAWVQLSEADREVSLVDAPHTDIAMVLGAGLEPSGRPSLYLRRRLDAGQELLDADKVGAILLTGDGTSAGHDETAAMRDYLVQAGVDARDLVIDPEGLDTRDSCIRAHDVYGYQSATVVTQDYHLPRALFLCAHAGIGAYGVAVSSSDASQIGLYRIREWGASVKAAFQVLTSAF